METAKKKILRASLDSVLENAKVPAKLYIGVLKALHQRIKKHDADREQTQKLVLAHVRQLREADARSEKYDSNIAEHRKELERIRATVVHGKDGERGIPGKDGRSINPSEIIEAVLSHIPIPQNGKDGRDGKDAIFDREKLIADIAEYIKNEQVLNLSHIKDAQRFIKDGVSYKLEELMHGGGSSSSTSSGGSSVIGTVIPSGSVNSSNTSFVASGHVIEAGSDDGIDADATLSYDSTADETTITYSVPPQHNVFALAIITVTTSLEVPAGTVNSINMIFTITGRVIFANADRLLDVSATVDYDIETGISTITYSAPPQNNVSALVATGVPMNQQVPSGTVNSSNVSFIASGKISAAYADSGIDVDAEMVYNFSTNQTTITYSVPPQNNVYAF